MARIPNNLDLYIPFEKLIGSAILEVITIEQKEILRIKPPFTVKFEPNVIMDIHKGLAQRVERGGILACKPTLETSEKVLCVEKAIFIKNVSSKPYNSYIPHRANWHKIMVDVLFKDKLIPVEFHSHPIASKKYNTKLFEYFNQMGTSTEDQALSELIVKIGNYRYAIPQVILIKEVLTSTGFFVGIYGGLIAPKDFEPEIFKKGGEKATELCEKLFKWFQQQLSDPKKREIGKIVGVSSLIAGLLFPKAALTLLAFLLAAGSLSIWRILPLSESAAGKILPYFGMANVSKTLRIRVPVYNIPNYCLKELNKIRLKEKRIKRHA